MSVHTEIAPVLLEFVADMHLHPFTHCMRGPTRVSAQGFVGALYCFLNRHASSDIGVVRVESESVFPSDHYPVRLCLLTLPALVAPGNPTSRARFKLGRVSATGSGKLLRIVAKVYIPCLQQLHRKRTAIWWPS